MRDEDGEKFIAKKTVLPTPKDPNNKLGTRSFMWMGPIDLATTRSRPTCCSQEDDGKMSDVGLINSGYQLTIRGREQQAAARQLDVERLPHACRRPTFEPKPDTWYTLKLTVVPAKDSATVRGKIWQRGETEPEKWTVEMVDKSPNLHGTPGVFGNTPDAEVYLDNVQVTPN